MSSVISLLTMSLKRTSASLLATASPHNPSVTLLTLSEDTESPRRSKRVKVSSSECVNEIKETVATSELIAVKTKSPKKSALKKPLDRAHPAPEKWREVYDAIKEMRKSGGPACNAPVDTMGCDQAQYLEIDPKVVQRFYRLQANTSTAQPVCNPRLLNLIFSNKRYRYLCCCASLALLSWDPFCSVCLGCQGWYN